MVQETGNNLNISKQSKYNTLSIRLSTDGFSFSIRNNESGNSCLVQSWPINEQQPLTVNLKNLLESDIITKQSYQKVYILIADSRYTLIPEQLHDPSNIRNIFYLSYPKETEEIILSNYLKGNKAYVIFSTEQTTYDLLQQSFQNFEIKSHISPICEYLSAQDLTENEKMYVIFHQESFDVFCWKENRLTLVNSFIYKQKANAIYYILYIWKQLDLNQQKAILYLAGNIPQEKETTHELKQYIQRVEKMNPSKDIDFYSLTHLSQSICE